TAEGVDIIRMVVLHPISYLAGVTWLHFPIFPATRLPVAVATTTLQLLSFGLSEAALKPAKHTHTHTRTVHTWTLRAHTHTHTHTHTSGAPSSTQLCEGPTTWTPRG